jgi:Zn finger protein HypA/HybF involved in hydrogenase expression
MLDKARLGVEDKAVRRGEIRGPASARCPECNHLAHWLTSGVIPPACPECGAAVEVVKKGG